MTSHDKIAEHHLNGAEEGELPEEHPKKLIVELCKVFYNLGYCGGTGGGVSIRDGNKIYIAPSGVQKERLKTDEIFVSDLEGKDLSLPNPVKNLKKSQCTPLFYNAYTMRNAGAVVHSHSQNAVMATMFTDKEFVITHQEMIKGIRKATGGWYRYYDRLVVPIIDNTAEEADLKERMAQAMREYPDTCAILVRRHGIYVWGDDWKQAKTMTECYDYLFEIAWKMRQLNMDPSEVPANSEYADKTGK